jgi:transposase-like protein
VNPTKVDRRYRKYSAETLLKAYEAVKERKVPVKTAARQFGVPENTLRDRVKGRIDPFDFCIGGDTTLSREEEEVLVEHLEAMSLLGYGYTNTKLQQVAGKLALDMGKKKKKIKP